MRHALDLFSLRGRVSRTQYLVAGVVLLAIKYAVDLLVSTKFHQPWNPLMYVSPRVSPLFRRDLPSGYWLALAAVALPFVAAGVSLSVRRLRDMGVHPFWAGLFFLPFAHFAFFLFLAIAPPHAAGSVAPPEGGPFRDSEAPPTRLDPPLARFIPSSELGALVLGMAISLALGLGCFVVSAQVSAVLGGGLFIGVPFGIGFLPAFTVARVRPIGVGRAIGYGLANLAVALVLLIALAWEGVACLVMALPIVAGVTIGGAAAGWSVGRTPLRRVGAALGVFVAPAMVGLDVHRGPAPEPLAVVSSVTIHAPPDVVWNNVVSFPPIDEPPAPIFAIVAMPIEARIDGQDPGALRRCIFTNGEFEEPIEVWDAPRELRFGVRRQPENLDHYIDVRRGQFLLTPNPDGTTTLTGTTWYELRVAPQGYWRLWTRPFLHAIHMRVLEHIQRLSEDPNHAALATAATQPEWMAVTNGTCRCTMHKH